MFGSGDTIELSCNTQSSSVSVFWFKDGIGIAPSNRTHIGQKLLKIINVSYDDSGLYSCKPRHSNEVLGNFTVRVTGTCRNRVDLLVFFGTFCRAIQACTQLVAVLSYSSHRGKYRHANNSKCFAKAPLVCNTWLAVSSSDEAHILHIHSLQMSYF